MRVSQYFLPLIKETPSEAKIASHRLMLRAGMIRQQASGIYSWLPLGLKVLKNIEAIVRDELNKAGCLEVLMPTLQLADLWRESDRYDAYGPEMLRMKDRHEREMLYGPTNEEMIHDIFRAYVKSYKNLPMNLYHMQWKFRDERRPRFGVMRGREFYMKDAYSFDVDKEKAIESYENMFATYLRIFERIGVKAIPMRAETGPIGGDHSHEFLVFAETGESEVFCDKRVLDLPTPEPGLSAKERKDVIEQWAGYYASTEDVHDEARYEADVSEENKLTARGIEVGQIFYYGDKYSVPMKVDVKSPDDKNVPIHGGSYGIGVSRLVGALIEAHHDEGGIIWPESVAPFQIGLINIRTNDDTCVEFCESIYASLTQAGVEVLYDDTDQRGGAKFASMDLIGLPWQVIVGPRGAAEGKVELKNRRTGEKEELSVDALLARWSAV